MSRKSLKNNILKTGKSLAKYENSIRHTLTMIKNGEKIPIKESMEIFVLLKRRAQSGRVMETPKHRRHA